MKRSVATSAMLLGLAGAVWLAMPGDAPAGRPPEVRAAVAAVSLPLPSVPEAPSRPASAAGITTAPATLTTELCGTGRLPLRGAGNGAETDDFDALPAPVGRLALQELQDRLLRVLAAGDARQRTATWLLRQPDDAAAQAAWAEGLLAQARASGDAQALRWAAGACGHTDDAARCRRELARSRIQAEPDNGLHWLEWAQEAPSAQEQAQAWQGLVRAQGWREHPAGLTAVTQAALASMRPVPAAYLRTRLARETMGRDSAQAPDGISWLESRCTQHRADCAQVAERMADQADSAALLQLAGALGRQAGWPDERVQAVTAATQDFHARLPHWPETPQASLACGAVEPQLAHVEAVAQRGELPRARSGP